ncbi:sugar ABC transporter permease [Clostridia bacterium]|nr:sugar ABC transporter permease [Clostridia bacterium]
MNKGNAKQYKISPWKRYSGAYKAFIILNVILMILLSFVFLAPYINVLAKSLNKAEDTSLGGIGLWPRKPTFSNLWMILSYSETIKGFTVTILRTVIGSVWALLVTYFASYAFLRKGLRGRGVILAYLTVPMFFGGGLIPTYVLYSRIHITNNFLVYVLPVGFNFFNMAVIRTYLANVPDSLRESARIDGASEILILFKIMLPLSLPIVATILLWNAVFHWNDWTTTLYYIRDPDLYTLQYNLQQVLKESERIQQLIDAAIASGRNIGDITQNMTGEAVMSAQIIVSTLPIILVYPFVQKYFIQGVMIGSVKE